MSSPDTQTTVSYTHLSVLATLLVLEVVIEKTLLTRIPVKFHFALPSGLAVLAQSSKAERLPVNYVALAGDSYAPVSYTHLDVYKRQG